MPDISAIFFDLYLFCQEPYNENKGVPTIASAVNFSFFLLTLNDLEQLWKATNFYLLDISISIMHFYK